MPATALTIVPTTRAGIDLATAVAANAAGNFWSGSGSEFLYVFNGGGGGITLTEAFGSGGTVDGQAATPRAISIPAGASRILGPYPRQWYNDASQNVNVSYSGVTGVLVMVLTVGT